jgi:hypothetical protein
MTPEQVRQELKKRRSIKVAEECASSAAPSIAPAPKPLIPFETAAAVLRRKYGSDVVEDGHYLAALRERDGCCVGFIRTEFEPGPLTYDIAVGREPMTHEVAWIRVASGEIVSVEPLDLYCAPEDTPDTRELTPAEWVECFRERWMAPQAYEESVQARVGHAPMPSGTRDCFLWCNDFDVFCVSRRGEVVQAPREGILRGAFWGSNTTYRDDRFKCIEESSGAMTVLVDNDNPGYPRVTSLSDFRPVGTREWLFSGRHFAAPT